jgi:hypothetical protein
MEKEPKNEPSKFRALVEKKKQELKKKVSEELKKPSKKRP